MFNRVISSPKVYVLILLLILVTGWFFFTFRILEVPPGINSDEAIIGYNAALVSRTGRDSREKFLPLFIATKDSLDWKQPVTFYSTVLFFFLFGPSYFNLRATSIFFALLGATTIFLLVKELLGIRKALFGAMIFILTPIVIIQSHLALENIAPVPFISLWLLSLIKYYKQPKNKYIIISAISLGISIYSYLGLRIIAPTLAMISLGYIFLVGRQLKNRLWSSLVIFILSILPFFLLLFSIKTTYPGASLGQNRPTNLSSYQEFLLPYLSFFDPTFLFITGDITPYHSTGKHGMLLISTLPLIILGIFQMVRKNDFVSKFILFTFFVSPIMYGITPSIHRASRLLFMLPFYIIFICSGLRSFLLIRNILWRTLLIIVIFILIALNILDFTKDYWYEYPKRTRSDFARPYQIVFERARYLTKENNLDPFIHNEIKKQHQIANEFFEQVYFPNKLKIWDDNQQIPNNSIIITSDYIISKYKNMTTEKFGDNGFGLVIKQ